MSNPFQRGLRESDVSNLKNGHLKTIVDKIKEHNSNDNNKKISLNIRKNYVNIYYNGGCLAKISFTRDGVKSEWDEGYHRNSKQEKLENEFKLLHGISAHRKVKDKEKHFKILDLNDLKNIENYLQDWNIMMKIMDRFGEKKERAFQQNVEFYNNKKDDNFIFVDVEYAISEKITQDRGFARKVPRFDMIALEKSYDGIFRLVLVENKIGYVSSSGESGIKCHLQDMHALLSDFELTKCFKKNIEKIANQLISLGLIPYKKNGIKIDLSQHRVKTVFMMSEFWSKKKSNSTEVEITSKTSTAIEKALSDLEISKYEQSMDIEFVFLGNFKNGKMLDNKYYYKKDEHCIKIQDVVNVLYE